MSLPTYRPGGQPCTGATETILQSIRSAEQLALDWDLGETIKPKHLAEWVEGSAISAGIAEQALESIAGEQQVLAFLKPKAINAHRTYGGAMPMNKWARTARQRYAKPCAGGWLAYGHAPLEGGELVPVTYKPDRPRRNDSGDPIKYERPSGSRPVPYLAPLDQASAEKIAARAGLVLPVELRLQPWQPWSAWCWLLAQPAVELCLDEGEKKAAAACSAGWLTIGLAGIYGGCPRPRDASGQPWGSPALIAELSWLKTIRPKGAPLTIAFDASEKPRGVLDVRRARRRLGRLLAADGHAVNIREMVQPEGATTFLKGTDDLLAHGGAEALAALPVVPLDLWLRESSEAALRARLVHAFSLDGGRRQHRRSPLRRGRHSASGARAPGRAGRRHGKQQNRRRGRSNPQPQRQGLLRDAPALAGRRPGKAVRSGRAARRRSLRRPHRRFQPIRLGAKAPRAHGGRADRLRDGGRLVPPWRLVRAAAGRLRRRSAVH